MKTTIENKLEQRLKKIREEYNKVGEERIKRQYSCKPSTKETIKERLVLDDLGQSLNIELDCLLYYKSPDNYIETAPGLTMEEVYLDQAKTFGYVYSTNTPHGIRQFDEFFGKQIRLGESSFYSKEELELLIRRNPHLHNIIKTNLIYNSWNR